jgi:hypothetical protein
MFHRRRRSGPDPFLQWKVRLFFLGAVVALVGLARDSSLLVGLAVLILLIGVAVRLLPRGKEEEGSPPDAMS